MTIEELQQENEKLQGRLQKAIAVFGEQKANIERLTQERDAAQAQVTALQEQVKRFENQINENAEKDEKFFEQLGEINQLEEANKKLTANCEALQQTVNQNKEDYEVLRVKSADEVANLTAELNAANTKLVAAQNEANENRQKAESTVEAAKKTVTQMQQLGNDFISNFNIFA